MDEAAFFGPEGTATSDVEIQRSIRRRMGSFKGRSKLIKISTPFAKTGLLWRDFETAYGKDNLDLLVWKSTTEIMNPALKEQIQHDRRVDPVMAQREYDAEFQDEASSFLSFEQITAAITPNCFERPPVPGFAYSAGLDPSGGGNDAFCLSIAHTEVDGPSGRVFVLQDYLKGWRRTKQDPVDLEAVVRECAGVCRRYRTPDVVGDKYSANWVRQAFERHGIPYVLAPEKSQTYLHLEPLFNQGALSLLDHGEQTRELQLLMRKHKAGGRVEIDHPRGAHDDYANAMALSACAALDLALGGPVNPRPSYDEMVALAKAFPMMGGMPNDATTDIDNEIHEGWRLWD